MRFDLLPLTTLAACAVLGLALDGLLIYVLVQIYRALVTWPVVQVAGLIGFFGFGWLVLSEHVTDLYVTAREREE